jgi:hypothetical protein
MVAMLRSARQSSTQVRSGFRWCCPAFGLCRPATSWLILVGSCTSRAPSVTTECVLERRSQTGICRNGVGRTGAPRSDLGRCARLRRRPAARSPLGRRQRPAAWLGCTGTPEHGRRRGLGRRRRQRFSAGMAARGQRSSWQPHPSPAAGAALLFKIHAARSTLPRADAAAGRSNARRQRCRCHSGEGTGLGRPGAGQEQHKPCRGSRPDIRGAVELLLLPAADLSVPGPCPY